MKFIVHFRPFRFDFGQRRRAAPKWGAVDERARALSLIAVGQSTSNTFHLRSLRFDDIEKSREESEKPGLTRIPVRFRGFDRVVI